MQLNDALTNGIQIISILKSVHNKYLLHRDIKPDNLMFSLSNKLYLIDFGLSKRYNYNGTHIPENKISHLIGTPNFVSLNVHNHIEPSRRDDIESCIYIILYLILGRLYWFNTDIEKMVELKKNVSFIPRFIKNMLVYVRNMTFEERPDYDLLINILKDEMHKN
jgi:serine/threonine protein kinase